jgi:glycosyltransferase involved in cell wall biosynthesis
VLWVGEASFLSTGYSTYGLQLLRRLHAARKYDICELGSFAPPDDTRWADLPWKSRSAVPHTDEERRLFDATQQLPFGEWVFDQICREHRPDIVFSIRDPWMDEYIARSKFRRLFEWHYMPTVDAEPQEKQWLELYRNPDRLYTYSEWAANVLSDLPNLRGTASPGADPDVFKPVVNRRDHRQKMGIDPDAVIVGTVMRNQRRKLYPDLIESFARLLEIAPADLARRAYLYLHTSWPDLGWNIPALILRHNLSGRVLMTYYCKACGTSYPSHFQDSLAVCRVCGQKACGLPNSGLGVSSQTLNEIYNLFDVYVQYSCSEGFGMPMVEAAAAGVPVFAVDYSAMSDVVRKLTGTPIKVQRFFYEPETGRRFALPDNADFVEKLATFLLKPVAARLNAGLRSRRAAEKHYSWDACAATWDRGFEEVPPMDPNRWVAPRPQFTPKTNIPDLPDEVFIRWGFHHVAGRPDLADSYLSLRMMRDLSWGAYTGPGIGGDYHSESPILHGNRFHEFNRGHCMQIWLGMAERGNG